MEGWHDRWRGLPRSPIFQHFRIFQEVQSTVEGMDHNGKPGSGSPTRQIGPGDPPPAYKFPIGNPVKRGRVLRAADVIPPFDKSAQPPKEGLEIPSYDLAENILAVQRQQAGRRRRGPNRAGAGPCICPGTAGQPRGVAPAELASQELLELQRVVAEIVARDIERLCRKPDRWPARDDAARFA